MILTMKKYILLLAAAVLGLSSCEDMLNKIPQDELSPDSYFRTETELQLFSNTFYNNMLDKSPYDEQSDQYIEDVLSDELVGGTKRLVPPDADKTPWDWSDLRKMNTLLAYAPEQCEDQAVLEKYMALTRFFRAYFYFEKVKRYGDVPWYDTELGSDDPALYKARDSREYIMDKMLKDIDYAIKYLPAEKFSSSSSGPFRANKWAALALKARFCLFEGTFRKYHNLELEGNDYAFYLNEAAKAAKDIIDEGVYKLYKTGHPESDYLNLFTAEDANTDEYILAIKFDYSLAIHHNATGYSILDSQGKPGMTKKMVNLYLMADGTTFTSQEGWATKGFVEEMTGRDPRLAQTIRGLGYKRIGSDEVLAPDLGVSVTGYQPIKFVQEPTASGGQVDRNDRSTNDLPVFRYAEVLLNYAEAKAELGTLTQDDLDISINEIRERAGMKDLDMEYANNNIDWYLSSKEYGFTNLSENNKGVILEIRRERAVELAQEGFRYYDLMRWAAGYCIDQEMLGMYFTGPGPYDLTGDGVDDIYLYDGESAPEGLDENIEKFRIGQDVYLSDGTSGYLDPTRGTRQGFNPERDYLYPIPVKERTLNNNLTQNPGWSDGLEL